MKKPGIITEDEKWQAVTSCNDGFDGLFFYAVKTTGIFCRPSCKSKTPIRGNVTFFDKAVDAVKHGFRPCKRCRPDQLLIDFDLELIKKVKDIFDANYNKQVDLKQISKQLGLSISHLARLFRQQRGMTPTQYIINKRVEKAAELLSHTDMNILEVCYTTGFKSLSNFYKCFKDNMGYTPKEYRKVQNRC